MSKPMAKLAQPLAESIDRLATAYGKALAKREDAIIPDPAFGGRGIIGNALADLRRRANRQLNRRLATLVDDLSRRYTDVYRRQWRRNSLDVFGREVQVQLEDAVRERNREMVERMRSLPDYLVDQTERDLIDAWQGRRSIDEVASILQVRLQITEDQARRSAANHLLRLNASLNQTALTSIGAERYVWNTQQDDRVRPLHRAREGAIFRWDEPPSDGHPGEPYNCRCFSAPVLEDLLN
jgi:SPP1 gp7 family putative phage head morphogenesis protein